jgi:polyisoprenoid-binding protein YceI
MTRIALALSLLVPSLALAAPWEIDGSHSQIGFNVKHMMVSTVHGQFKKAKGTLDIDDKNLEKSTINVEIDAASIDTNDPKRDAHLRSSDFFDVEKFPALTFKSKKVKALGGGRAQALGDLTIHGITREVTLDVTELTAPVKDPWGGYKRAASASTKINRSDYGLKWNKALEAGGVLVADEVKITLDLELGGKPEATAKK